MVLTTTRFNLNWLFLRSSFTEQNLFCFKITKLSKLWRCIRNCINGTKLSNVLRSISILMSKNSRRTITHGFCRLDKNRKLQKLRKKKEITILLSTYILREVFLPELPTSSITPMLVSQLIYLKRQLLVLLLQVCMKKLVNSMRKWICFKKHSIVM